MATPAEFSAIIESRNPVRHAGIDLEEASVKVRHDVSNASWEFLPHAVSAQDSPTLKLETCQTVRDTGEIDAKSPSQCKPFLPLVL